MQPKQCIAEQFRWLIKKIESIENWNACIAIHNNRTSHRSPHLTYSTALLLLYQVSHHSIDVICSLNNFLKVTFKVSLSGMRPQPFSGWRMGWQPPHRQKRMGGMCVSRQNKKVYLILGRPCRQSRKKYQLSLEGASEAGGSISWLFKAFAIGFSGIEAVSIRWYE
jgi:hypothetical protein